MLIDGFSPKYVASTSKGISLDAGLWIVVLLLLTENGLHEVWKECIIFCIIFYCWWSVVQLLVDRLKVIIMIVAVNSNSNSCLPIVQHNMHVVNE